MIKELFRTISIWIIVLPLIAGLINYKGLNKDSRWIFSLVVIGFIPQILTFIINKQDPLLNLSYNIYTLVEFGILYFLFFDKYQHPTIKVILKITLFVYIVIATAIILRDGIRDKFLNDLVCVNNVAYMIWILLLLKEQYNIQDSIIHKKNPFAWYLLAFLIYAPCSIIAFALYHYIRGDASPVLKNLWIIQSVCNILLYILFSVGLLLRGQKNKFKM